MNTLEAYIILSPDGKEEECARFVIDDVSTPFVLNATMTEGRQYALSFWVKSESEGKISAENNTFDTTAEWKKHSAVFNASAEYLPLYFETVGTYYIYHPQLEIGNKATDWTPAPEDSKEEIENTDSSLRQLISEQKSSILTDATGIYAEALKSYTLSSDFEDYKTTNTANVDLISKQLGLKFTESTEKTNKVKDDLQTQINEITQWFTFDINGMEIGQSNSPFKVVIDNDRFSMYANGTEFLWLRPNESDGSNIPILKVAQKINILGYEMIEDDEGRVNEVYVGV